MKFRFIFLILPFLVSACKHHPFNESKGKLRLVNASYNTGNINMYVDYEKVYATDVQYLNYSLFRDYLSGRKKLQIRNSGGTMIIDTAISIEDNKAYSVYLYDSANQVRYKQVEEVFIAPGGSNCKVRFLHLSNDAPEVNVIQQQDSQYRFMNYMNGDISNYISIPSGYLAFNVKNASTNTTFYTNYFEYKPGYFYTLYLKGNMASQMDDSIGIFTIKDNGNYQ